MIIHPTNENVAVKEYLSSEFDVVQNIYDNLEMLREVGTKTTMYQNIVDALPMLTSLDTSNIDAVAVKLGMLTTIKDNLSMLTNVAGNATNIIAVSNMKTSIDSIIGLQGLLSTIASQITNGVFKGDAGKSLIPKGSVQHVVDLPADNISRANQVYSVLDTGDMYIYNDLGVKLNYGNMRGIQGAQGEQGIQGIKGDNGTNGLKGDTGGKGDKGDNGSKGDTPVLDKISGTSYDLTKIQKTFQFTTTNESVGWTIGSYLKLYNSSSIYALGIVTDVTNSYVVLDIIDVIGSGIYNLWYIGLAGNTGAKGDKGDQGLQGIKGDKGDIPSHAWTGTQLKFQLPDGSWGNLVDLKGSIGNTGNSAWTPVFAIVTDGTRQVVKITDWTGGTGTKPGINVYISSTGYTTIIANAVSIKGDQGIQGIKGDTGNTGNTGSTGATGSAATVTLGTITTGNAGTGVIITNVGTTSAAVLNFTIPRGNTGATGTGVITGGATGQVLKKVSTTDFDVVWGDVIGLPSGGSTNQILKKNSNTSQDAGWSNELLGVTKIGVNTVNPLAPLHIESNIQSNETVPGFVVNITGESNKLHLQNYYPGVSYISQNLVRDTGGNWGLDSITGYGNGIAFQSKEGIGTYGIHFMTTDVGYSGGLPTKMFLKYDGKLGLGTTDPTAEFDNVGTTRLRGALYDSANSVGTPRQSLLSITGKPTWSSLTKADVGLANVDNTTDANKPVSTATANALSGKQPTLVSGTSIKTINNISLLNYGNIAVQPTLVSGTNIKTINNTSLLNYGDLALQPTLVSGTNIKTVNNVSLLGSGNIPITSGLVSNLTCAVPLVNADNQGTPTYYAMVQTTPNTLGGSVDGSGYWTVPATGVYDIYVEGRPDFRNEGGIYGVFSYRIQNHTTSTQVAENDCNFVVNGIIGLWNKFVVLGASLTAGEKLKFGMHMYMNSGSGGYVDVHTAKIRIVSR